MISLLSTTKDIYFNLAAEEFLLKNKTEDIFMLWQSESCIVVGKHQNAIAEIHHEFVYKNRIPVARRLTGGGTVFHGNGNLNFTFIREGKPGKLVDFNYFVTPIVEYLATLGIEARVGEKNDIRIRGLKISGNAEHVYKQRVLHHGTLLFDADLSLLNESIKVVPGRYKDKAVQSNRSEVTNLIDYLPEKMSLKEFEEGLFRYISRLFQIRQPYELSKDEREQIRQLRDEKYSQREWIFGYSPDFQAEGNILYQGEKYTLNCSVKKGIITEFHWQPDAEDSGDFPADNFIGQEFDYSRIKDFLETSGADPEWVAGILKALF